MTWCARCDNLTTGGAGAACPTCGEPTLDTSPSPRRSRSPIQVLELEDAPVLPTIETVQEPMPDPMIGRRPRLPRVRARSRVIAVVLASAIAGTTFALTRPESARDPAAAPVASVTPAASPIASASPPLGGPVAGSVLLASETGFRMVDLRTGTLDSLSLEIHVNGFAAAPNGGTIAYVDEYRTLMITTFDASSPTTIATEVNLFAWTPDGEGLVVVRSQEDARGRGRTRMELITISDRAAVLLLESYVFIDAVISRGGVTLVTMHEGEDTAVYEILPGSRRLVRKDSILLDVSPDGRKALVAGQGTPRLLMVDIATGKAARIGPARFVAQEARFSPDGRAAAVIGSARVTMEESCEHPGQCAIYPMALDQVLWSLDTKKLALRPVEVWTAPGIGGGLSWGPEGWVFLLLEGNAVAISMTDPTRPTVVLPGWDPAGWLYPAYVS